MSEMIPNDCKNCQEQPDINASIDSSKPLKTSTPISEGKSTFTFGESTEDSGSGANWWPCSESEEIDESSGTLLSVCLN